MGEITKDSGLGVPRVSTQEPFQLQSYENWFTIPETIQRRKTGKAGCLIFPCATTPDGPRRLAKGQAFPCSSSKNLLGQRAPRRQRA